jgi:hypothetical protein
MERAPPRATIKALPAPLHHPRPYGSSGLLPLPRAEVDAYWHGARTPRATARWDEKCRGERILTPSKNVRSLPESRLFFQVQPCIFIAKRIGTK